MKVHFIAVGGSVMHNLAIALKRSGHVVSGSDDEIYEPARSRLSDEGLLPSSEGWDPDRIGSDTEAVILGMHAKADNPELARAKELGVRIYSFPEFIMEQSRAKHRVVIAGSHGKTTITAMVMHVLRGMGREFDYLIGGQVEGFDVMVRLTNDAPTIILEGDEYLSSPIDPRPKFLAYKPHMALISGIAWDHINVFPTEEQYVYQFEQLVENMPKAGVIVFNEEDKRLVNIIKTFADKEAYYLYPYKTPDYRIRDGNYEVKIQGIRQALGVIGKHNMTNLEGAWQVCDWMGIELEDFLEQIKTFTGASKRLEKIYEDKGSLVYKDFAHSPSKVKATTEAVAELYKKRNVVACLELHTFSSLNKAFLSQYKDTLKSLKNKIVFVNEHTLKMKNYPAITREELVKAFNDKKIELAFTIEELKTAVRKLRKDDNNVFLMMSSGNFANQDLTELALS